MIARQVLTLSPFVITGVYAALIVLPRVGVPAPVTALQMCSIIWAFALYLVAKESLNERARFGRAVFTIAIALLIGATSILFESSESEPGDLLFLVLPISGFFVFVSIGLAASALLRTERRNDFPLRWSWALVFFSIAFLPLGIWLLRPRVNRLLAQEPRL